MAFIYCVPPREVLFELTTVLEEEEGEEGAEDDDVRVREASVKGRRPSSVRVQLHVADFTRRSGDGAEKLSAGSATVIHPLTDAAEAYIKIAESRRSSSAIVEERRDEVEGSSDSGCRKCTVAECDHKAPVEQGVVECVAYSRPIRSWKCRLAALVSSIRQRLGKAGINDVLLVTVLVLILVTVSLLTSIFEHRDTQMRLPPAESGIGTDNALDDTWFVSRELWQAGQRSPYLTAVNTTLQQVVVTQTITKTCNSLHSCAELVKNIQTLQIAHQGYEDISFNFLVGGDGRIYEGRSWSAHAPMCNNKCISIGFIGDYSSYGYDTKVTSDQLKYFEKLLTQGVAEEWLSPEYYIIPICLIKNTESPMDNIISALQHVPHFSMHPSKVFNNSCTWATPLQDIGSGPDNSPSKDITSGSIHKVQNNGPDIGPGSTFDNGHG